MIANTPSIQLTHAKGKHHESPLWGQIKAGSSGLGWLTRVEGALMIRPYVLPDMEVVAEESGYMETPFIGCFAVENHRGNL